MNKGNKKRQNYNRNAYQTYADKTKLEIKANQSRRELNIKAAYKKMLKKELKPEAKSVDNSQDHLGSKSEGPSGIRSKPSALKTAVKAFSKKGQERIQKESMIKKQQEERQLAIQSRKQRRLEKFKVLNQKTPKGQPVMKGRMQLLLQKIQSGL